MSLDVWLTVPITRSVVLAPTQKIFIREDGQTKEITMDEWEEKYPDKDPLVMIDLHENTDTWTVFEFNITTLIPYLDFDQVGDFFFLVQKKTFASEYILHL